MAAARPLHVAVPCLKTEIEQTMDAYLREYDLVSMCGYQVGTGFGAYIEFMLTFKLKDEMTKRRAA